MLLEKIQDDLKIAMKAHLLEEVSVLRMLISALKYAAIDNSNLSESDEIRVLSTEAKKRKEAAVAYRGVRDDKADLELRELDIIQKYLPETISDQRVLELITEIKTKNVDLKGGSLVGKVMSEIKIRGWFVDGSHVKELIEA